MDDDGDAARGHARGVRRADRRGQGAAHRRVQLHGAAPRRGARRWRAAASCRAYVAIQPHYNLMHREEYEGALAELCAREGVACVPYFALASGFLTGKYRIGGAGRRLAARRHGARLPRRARARACSRCSTISPRPTRRPSPRSRSRGSPRSRRWRRRSPAPGRPSSSPTCCRWPASSWATRSSGASTAASVVTGLRGGDRAQLDLELRDRAGTKTTSAAWMRSPAGLTCTPAPRSPKQSRPSSAPRGDDAELSQSLRILAELQREATHELVEIRAVVEEERRARRRRAAS